MRKEITKEVYEFMKDIDFNDALKAIVDKNTK